MGIGAHSPYCHIGCNVPVLMLVDLVYFPVAIGGGKTPRSWKEGEVLMQSFDILALNHKITTYAHNQTVN